MQNALPPTPERAPGLNVALQRVAIISLISLLLWCVVWEIWFAPLRPGGTLLFLKALPLAFAYSPSTAPMLLVIFVLAGPNLGSPLLFM